MNGRSHQAVFHSVRLEHRITLLMIIRSAVWIYLVPAHYKEILISHYYLVLFRDICKTVSKKISYLLCLVEYFLCECLGCFLCV